MNEKFSSALIIMKSGCPWIANESVHSKSQSKSIKYLTLPLYLYQLRENFLLLNENSPHTKNLFLDLNI